MQTMFRVVALMSWGEATPTPDMDLVTLLEDPNTERTRA